MDQLQRIEIRAPQAGVVQQLAVHAKGAVLGPGEQIMLIVPEADALVVEVRADPQKIDQIKLGQPGGAALPQFQPAHHARTQWPRSRIAADVIQDQRSGEPYFLVRISMSLVELARLNGLKLVPGMPVEAFIRTDERTMLNFFKPLTDQARRAFREK